LGIILPIFLHSFFDNERNGWKHPTSRGKYIFKQVNFRQSKRGMQLLAGLKRGAGSRLSVSFSELKEHLSH